MSVKAAVLRGSTGAAAIAIFVADIITPLDIAAATLYVGVVLMTTRFLRPRGIAMAGLGCEALTLLSWYLSPPAVARIEAVSNECISMAAIVVVTILAMYAKRSEAALLESERQVSDVKLALAHANRLTTMGELVASISHELKQPIGAARNNANAARRFLAKDPPDLAEASEALECVVTDTYRAVDVIGRIRDQVRKVPSGKGSVNLNDVVINVIALLKGELSKNRVTVRTQLAEDLPPVHGDRVQLQQVMLNLILNAIEAMAGADAKVRELVICTESSPSQGQVVTVGDSGPGIAPEDRDRVFESFFTTKASGMGIGLSICRSIIDAHGGKLWADSHQPHGAAFRFSLPSR
jgi:C4-dicarboxylate-specific signal transduction histidine kinase